MVFVCVTLIGVKSKYGSCSGNCTGLIKINNTPPPPKKKKSRKVLFVGMMGWAVNSIAKAVEGSIPFLPINCKVVARYSLAIVNKKRSLQCVLLCTRKCVFCFASEAGAKPAIPSI